MEEKTSKYDCYLHKVSKSDGCLACYLSWYAGSKWKKPIFSVITYYI